MTPRTRIAILVIALVAVAGAACATLFTRAELAGDIARAERIRCDSLRFVDALQQSTDDLTRLARAYVATGDERFVDYYHWEHGVRDGTVGRAVDSWRVYWDLVAAGQDHPRPDGEPLSLVDWAQDYPFTAAEREVLLGILATEAELKEIEEEALSYRAGKFAEVDGRMRVVETPDPVAAAALLYDPPYLELRAACLNAIDIFYGLVETRTDEDLAALAARRGTSGILAGVLAAVAALLAVVTLGSLRACGGPRASTP